jgi:ABC-type protease/lipase transport system fused ATPase/permease subunit
MYIYIYIYICIYIHIYIYIYICIYMYICILQTATLNGVAKGLTTQITTELLSRNTQNDEKKANR